MAPERIRAGLKVFLAVVCSCGLALGLFELFVRLLGGAPWRTHGAEWGWRQYENGYSNNVTSVCLLQESLIPHPLLGFVLGPFEPCHRFRRNNRGFQDRRDMPEARDPGFFTILLTGGSVAAQMAYGPLENNPVPYSWLEHALNRRFVGPNGMPFRVLSGAMGVWRFPAQVLVTGLFGDRVDAVVSLDGYNEELNAAAQFPLDQPDPLTILAVQAPERVRSIFSKLRFLRAYRLGVTSRPALRKLHLPLLVFERLLGSVVPASGEPLGTTPAFTRQFSFPEGLDPGVRIGYNQARWKHYRRAFEGAARALGLRSFHFIQPIPHIDKVLTAEELAAVGPDLSAAYRRDILEPTEELRKEGLPVLALTDVFKRETRTLYHDAVHCGFDPDYDSPGYGIMAERMAIELGKAWGLRRKPSVATR